MQTVKYLFISVSSIVGFNKNEKHTSDLTVFRFHAHNFYSNEDRLPGSHFFLYTVYIICEAYCT